MLAKVNSYGILGITGYPVTVEVDVANGLPMFDIVGLPDASVKESRERVRSALRNGGFEMPNLRITVNLAPADIKKEGALRSSHCPRPSGGLGTVGCRCPFRLYRHW